MSSNLSDDFVEWVRSLPKDGDEDDIRKTDGVEKASELADQQLTLPVV